MSLNTIVHRLKSGKPRTIGAHALQQLFIYTDAAQEPPSRSAVLVNHAGTCKAWFGFPLGVVTCLEFGRDKNFPFL